MNSKIKVIIVGAGNISEEYIKILKTFKKIKVIGIISKKPKNSKLKASKFNIPNYGTSITKMFSLLNPELAIICVSPSETYNVCKKILKFNCATLVEKPLGITLNECKKISNISKIGNKKLFIALNRRHLSSTKILQNKLRNIKSKRIVNVFDQESTINAFKNGHSKKVVANWMYANSIHLIDYFNMFCRGNYKNVKTQIFKLNKVEKFIISKFSYNSGDIGIYHGYWNRTAPWKVTVSCGSSFFTLSPIEKLSEKNKKGQLISYKQDKVDKKFKPGFFSMTKEFINAYNKKKNNLTDVSNNLKTMRLINKIFKK